MQDRKRLWTWALLFLGALSLSAAPMPSRTGLMPVSRANLCVTEGTIDELPGERLSVNVPKMRAYLNAFTPQSVEAHFTYLGATESETRLGSGELRRQFGIKLRAQDACNLVYAMWRIEPESKLVVSVKSNPGQHNSAKSRIPEYQGSRRHASSRSTSRRHPRSSRGDERSRPGSLRRRVARLGRFSGARRAGLRWAGRDSLRQCAFTDRAAGRQSATRTHTWMPVGPGGIRIAI